MLYAGRHGLYLGETMRLAEALGFSHLFSRKENTMKMTALVKKNGSIDKKVRKIMYQLSRSKINFI